MPEWKEEAAIADVAIANLPLQRTIGLTWRLGQHSAVIGQFRALAASHKWH
jgi:hypothetical protein